MLEGPSSRLFDKTSPHTPQMAIFDSSTLAAGRLDQRKETKTSRQPAAHRSCDAIADPAPGLEEVACRSLKNSIHILYNHDQLKVSTDFLADADCGDFAIFYCCLALGGVLENLTTSPQRSETARGPRSGH